MFADMQMVQEAAEPSVFLFLNDMPNYWRYRGYGVDRPPASFDFRFSDFCVAPGSCHFGAGGVTLSSALNLSLQDCDFYAGWFLIGYGVQEPTPCDLVIKNNLFDSVNVEFPVGLIEIVAL